MKQFLPLTYMTLILCMLCKAHSHAQTARVELDIKKGIDSNTISIIHKATELFPVLYPYKIKVRVSSIKTTLNCKPTLRSIFRSKERRIYIIKINSGKPKNGINYSDIPLLAKEGLWSHEIAHIFDYQSLGFTGILQRGIWHIIPRKREKFEKSIDELTIRHGAGMQLHSWSRWLLDSSGATPSYKIYKRKYYLEPGEIVSKIEELKQ